MHIVVFTHRNQASRIGLIEGEEIVTSSWSGSLISLIESGITPGVISQRYPIVDCKVHAPLHPRKILCIGRNYAAHAAELGNETPEAPLIFAKFATSVIGHGDTITWKRSMTDQVDWEGELAVIIGKRAKNITAEQALGHIFGYTIANDVSARDLQESEAQWARAKGMDTFCPLGPAIVTRDEIPDPQALSIQTSVNDEMMQDGHTKEMIHGVFDLIAYCSQTFTLEPGDLLLTGTPSGVGKGMKPPRYLQDGDTVSVTIDKLGTLSNPCKVSD